MAELSSTVHATLGEEVTLRGFHGRHSPAETNSLSCNHRPDIVAFELCVMLAGDVAAAVCRVGYTYRASDFVDEMRRLALLIGTPNTEAVGRDLIFYWPSIEVVVG